jgi:hypothetical protein
MNSTTIENMFTYDFNIDKVMIRHSINYAEEKLMVFSILTIDFIFTYADIVIRYYNDNFFNVNIFFMTLLIFYKIQQLYSRIVSSFSSSSKYQHIIETLVYEKEMLLNEREKLYKNIIYGKTKNNDKNKDELLINIKNIINSEDRAAKKVVQIGYLIKKI